MTFARVVDTVTGHHITITTEQAEADPARFRPVAPESPDAAPVDGRGLPRAPKYRIAPSADQGEPDTTDHHEES